jgi:hypothetical protein
MGNTTSCALILICHDYIPWGYKLQPPNSGVMCSYETSSIKLLAVSFDKSPCLMKTQSEFEFQSPMWKVHVLILFTCLAT